MDIFWNYTKAGLLICQNGTIIHHLLPSMIVTGKGSWYRAKNWQSHGQVETGQSTRTRTSHDKLARSHWPGLDLNLSIFG